MPNPDIVATNAAITEAVTNRECPFCGHTEWDTPLGDDRVFSLEEAGFVRGQWVTTFRHKVFGTRCTTCGFLRLHFLGSAGSNFSKMMPQNDAPGI
jgi:hypothetical protein